MNSIIVNMAKSTTLFLLILILSAGVEAQTNFPPKIGLLYSTDTEYYQEGGSDWIKNQVADWEVFLIKNKYRYSVIFDHNLDSELNNSFKLLIALNAKMLNNEAFEAIKNYLMNGGSLLANWDFGFYDEDYTKRDENLLNETFGIKIYSKYAAKDIVNIHTILGATPFSVNIPNGFRLKLNIFSKPTKFEIVSSLTKPIGYWRNKDNFYYGYNPYDKSTGGIFGKLGKGKFVWFSFNYEAVRYAGENKQVFENLLKNSINWLLGYPVIWLNSWPEDKKSGVVLSCDIIEDFDNVNNLIDLYQSENIQGNFFISRDDLSPDFYNKILKNGELGLYGAGSDLLRWQEYEFLLKKVSHAKELLEKAARTRITSIKAPESEFDLETLDLLKNVKINLLSDDKNSDSAVPKFGANDIFIIPKTGLSDKTLVEDYKFENTDLLTAAFLNDFNRVEEERGLYVLNINSEILCSSKYIQALNKFLNEVKYQSWITTFYRVKEWFTKRDNISVNIYPKSDYNWEIILVNNNTKPIYDFSFTLVNIGDNFNVEFPGEVVRSSLLPDEELITVTIDKFESNRTELIKLVRLKI